MIIDQLPSVGTPSLTDETVTEQGQNLFKVTWQRLLNLFKGNTTLSELTNDAGFVDTAGAAAAAPVQSVNGMTGAVVVPSAPLSDDNPQPLGTATPGTSTNVSRADHVHAMPSAEDVGAMSEWALLWTNASPASSFSAQTISLDLSVYDAVIVDLRAATDRDVHGWFLAPKGQESAMGLWAPNGGNLFLRDATPSQTGVTFSGGYYGSPNPNDGCGLPYKIYGVKGVNS